MKFPFLTKGFYEFLSSWCDAMPHVCKCHVRFAGEYYRSIYKRITCQNPVAYTVQYMSVVYHDVNGCF